jgi:hypothetical protein
MTGIMYLDVLEEFLKPVLEECLDDVLFQQDGALLHFHKEVTDFLNCKFPEKWIDRGEPVSWPPSFPDFTSLILSEVCQGCCVHATIGCHLSELPSRIRTVVAHYPQLA